MQSLRIERIVKLVSIIITLSSCSIPRQLDRAHYKRPDVTASKCESWYPIREIYEKETEYLPGKTTIDTQYLPVDCTDTANKGKTVRVPCKSYSRVVTAKITEKLIKESTAKLDAQAEKFEKERKEWLGKEREYIRQIEKQNAEVLTLKDQLEYYLKIKRWLLWIGGSIIALWLVMKLKGGWLKIIINLIKSIF